MENRIAELKHGLAADDFCLRELFATEAAFRSILLLFNLLGEFQRACRFTPAIASPPRCAPMCFSAALYSAAPATAWSCICPLPGAACSNASHCWKVS
jgi:hypothetical protein